MVFLNGYQFGCTDRPTFEGTFGDANQVLERDGRVSLFFNNCDVPGNPPIEVLGNAFRDYLNGLQFTGGRPVTQVDVVAHSMGGMIVRSYLAGKQTARGVFQPPADPKIRRVVFLAVPFFGSFLADFTDVLPGYRLDEQTRELQPGSAFTFDLATWNQGREDLRGVDALAVITNGGSAGATF
ncbi:MAG: hypothetical protein H7039_00575, partial [Bryobacteraceae bacterium]|nr:hypothetical protein [Bryobacteraceae bacterium]